MLTRLHAAEQPHSLFGNSRFDFKMVVFIDKVEQNTPKFMLALPNSEKQRALAMVLAEKPFLGASINSEQSREHMLQFTTPQSLQLPDHLCYQSLCVPGAT